MEKRLNEINARKMEIRTAIETATAEQLAAFQTELTALEAEERSVKEKMEIASKINVGEVRGQQIQKPQGEVKLGTESMEYRKAFMNYVLRGVEVPMELRTDFTTATTDIGTVIPAPVMEKIVEKLEATGMLLPLVTRTAYKGGLAIPTSAVKPTATWVNQSAGSDKQKKTTSSVTFGYFKLRCAVAVSLEVDNMALPVFEAAIINNIVEAMTKALEQAIISGVGSASPKGILAETPVTSQALTGTPTWAKAVEAEGALPIEYEADAVWCMTKKTFMAFVGETDDAGQPVARINYGIAGRPERFLLGRPVVLCNYLDSYATDLASGKCWAFLFNFKDYVLNTNYQMTMKKYEDNDTEDQITKAVMLVDGKVVDKNSLVTLSMA